MNFQEVKAFVDKEMKKDQKTCKGNVRRRKKFDALFFPLGVKKGKIRTTSKKNTVGKIVNYEIESCPAIIFAFRYNFFQLVYYSWNVSVFISVFLYRSFFNVGK